MRGKWSDVELCKQIFTQSKTYSEVLKKLGLTVNVTNYTTAKKFISLHGVSVDHFVRYYFNGSQRIKKDRIPDENVFVEDSYYSRSSLKKRVIDQKLKPYECDGCGNKGTWKGERLSLQLEHTNGNNTDNRLENLCFLCPNCHSQTLTYAGKKNKTRQIVSQAEYIEGVKQKALQANEPLISNVLKSDIDFTKFGWSKKVAALIKKKPQRVSIWMKRYMPDFYEKRCFKKRQNTW